MTRDEILSMKAGRELDTEIAHRVMGLGNRFIVAEEQGTVYMIRYGPPDSVIYGGVEPPNYSTDIAAAWEVTKKVLVSVEGVVWVDIGFDKTGKTRCDFGLSLKYAEKLRLFHPRIGAASETAPEAICKAALLAVLEQ